MNIQTLSFWPSALFGFLFFCVLFAVMFAMAYIVNTPPQLAGLVVGLIVAGAIMLSIVAWFLR